MSDGGRRIVRYRRDDTTLLWILAAASIVGLIVLAVKLWRDNRRLARRVEELETWR